MTRTRLADRILPRYTRKEEWINSISHMAGGAFGIWTLVSCIIVAVSRGSGTLAVISSAVYGASMIILYTISSVYHALHESMAKKVLQIIDHCSIFILIAGTYTPMLMCGVREYNPTSAYVMLGIVWGLTILGVVFNSIDLKKFSVFSMICYIGIGWMIIIELRRLYSHFGTAMIALVLAGGISYTIGAILYGIGAKKKYFHSVFHFFVLAGSILQYIAIVKYVI